MLHCIACDSPVDIYHDYCQSCEEAISHTYDTDSKYIKYLKELHPYSIPVDFLSVTYGFTLDAN